MSGHGLGLGHGLGHESGHGLGLGHMYIHMGMWVRARAWVSVRTCIYKNIYMG